MRLGGVVFGFLLVGALASSGSALGAGLPTIQDVQIDRGHDTDAPDWDSFHQRVVVTAADTDGADDIASITITDPDLHEHMMTPGDRGWSREDDFTIRCEWSEWQLLEPPMPGAYDIRVVDSDGDEGSLTTADAPAVSDVHPQLTSPAMGSVIYDTSPTFEWTEGIAGAVHTFSLGEEGTGVISVVNVGSDTSLTGAPALEPNHSYFWWLESWSADDDRVSDPRVSIWTAQHTHGRFTEYGDWPETPPTLEGKFAYSFYQVWSYEDWGPGGLMLYNTDPTSRRWLGADGSGNPDWSPDGKKLLFSRSGTAWVDALDGSEPVQIPGTSGEFFRWSPDGKQVTYTGLGDVIDWNGIWVADADGSNARCISDSFAWEYYSAWSPDGRWISHGRPNDEGSQGVWLVHPDGTGGHDLVATGVAGYPGYQVDYLGHGSWSPDGTKLAVDFWAGDSIRIGGIGTIPREGGLVTPLFLSHPEAICCSISRCGRWSPDGTKIVFESAHHLAIQPGYGQFEPGVELWVVNADGSGGLTRLTYDHSFDSYVSWWAPNTPVGEGSSVTVVESTVTFDSVSAEGSTAIVVSALPAAVPDGMSSVGDHAYTISTTAKISGAITFALDYGDTNYPPVLGERLSLLLWDGANWIDITTFPIDTANSIIRGQFTPGEEREWFIALALNKPPVPKAKVMYEGCTLGLPTGLGLFVANADLSDPIRLTAPAATGAPCSDEAWAAWAPDGQHVAFGRPSTGTIEVIDLTALVRAPGQDPTPLLNDSQEPVRGHFPSWTPSSDGIVFLRWDPGQSGIWAAHSDGTGEYPLYLLPDTQASWAMMYPSMSPDGSRVAFLMGPLVWQDQHLYLLEGVNQPGGVTLRQLTSDDSYNDQAPCWSADGDHIVFTRSPRGAAYWESSGSDLWIIDVVSGNQKRITFSPEIRKVSMGWCAFDGYIYTNGWSDVVPAAVSRILPDGTGEEVVVSPWAMIGSVERFTWAQHGVWIDGMSALPGEMVNPKIGIADAEGLAGVQARVRGNGLGMYSAELGESVLDWLMPASVVGTETIALLGLAPDPGTQSVSGAAELFGLDVVNPSDAAPGSTRLLTFDQLLLSDDMGDPIQRTALAGGVHTIPFVGLQLSAIAGPIGADATDPMALPVTITALDRNGWTMPDAGAAVSLGAVDPNSWPLASAPTVSPAAVPIAGGTWSGQVGLAQPSPAVQLHASWEDIGVFSNTFQAIGKGDTNADNRVSVFDVVKVANMAIGRGTWADWQFWAGDLNRDHTVNIFDVVRCASEAMQGMSTVSVGRGGGGATVPAGPVTVIPMVTDTGTTVRVAVDLSQSAGLAGVQFELQYDAERLKYTGMSRGSVLQGASSWTSMDNDLGGTVKAIAYSASLETLSAGHGTVVNFTFNRIGKGNAKPEMTSARLSDAGGTAVASRIAKPKVIGKGK